MKAKKNLSDLFKEVDCGIKDLQLSICDTDTGLQGISLLMADILAAEELEAAENEGVYNRIHAIKISVDALTTKERTKQAMLSTIQKNLYKAIEPIEDKEL